MNISGYLRSDKTVGIRNHLLVLPSVVRANNTTRRIAEQFHGAVWITYVHGCGSHNPADIAQTYRILIGFGSNPNGGACIVVGYG